MKIAQLIAHLEEKTPLAYAESFDNVGLLLGDAQWEIKGVLIAHDALEEVVQEAIEQQCNLIIAFHPILFSPLKKLNPNTYTERAIIKAIRHDVAIYAMHTALDNQFLGVNATIADALGLEKRKILLPQPNTLLRLTTYVPTPHAQSLREALFAAGAGSIGNYEQCSFNLQGTGTFLPNYQSNPTIGNKGELCLQEETQIGVIFPRHLKNKVLSALFTHHPYEEVAYEVVALLNEHQHIGLGMLGELSEPIEERAFLALVKQKMNTPLIRHSALMSRPIKKVAVLGGSGAFAIEAAIAQKADAFITADLKYHDFFKAKEKLLLADIGHFESEQFIKTLLYADIIKKFHTFATKLSKVNTNPIQYL